MPKEKVLLSEFTTFVGSASAENLEALAGIVFSAPTDDEGNVLETPTSLPSIVLSDIRATTPVNVIHTWQYRDVRDPSSEVRTRSNTHRGTPVRNAYEQGIFMPQAIEELSSKCASERLYFARTDWQSNRTETISGEQSTAYRLKALGTLTIAEADIRVEGVRINISPKSNRPTGHEFKA